MAKEKTNCDYEGKATLITARSKGNATLIAALSGLLLAGGNFLNDFLDRQHQRQVDESTYNAALAEIRSLKEMVTAFHPHGAEAAGERRYVFTAMPEMMAEMSTESDAEDDLIPEPEPGPGLVQAPSFDEIQEYVQQSGRPLLFEVAQPAD